MTSRNPRLIVRFRLSTAGHRWTVGANYRGLIRRLDLLTATGRPLRTLAALTCPTLLGEECCNPGRVDEVADAAEGTGEDKIEEDAR